MKGYKNLDVVILCGGKGTRLQSVLSDRPKILAPLNGETFLDILLFKLKKMGFARVIMALGYGHEKIISYIGEKDWDKHSDLKLVYSIEPTPMGTGGAIKFAESHIKSDSFVVINGDTFFDVDFPAFAEFHQTKNALVSLAVSKRKELHNHYHVVTESASGKISEFSSSTSHPHYYLMTGVFLLRRDVLGHMAPGTFSLEVDFLPSALSHGLYAFDAGADFHDIGTPELYEAAKKLGRRSEN
ncbi:MAG: hypothetical protein COU11_00630 [Candidatus Harrisonbacteria bacterium CG10_big_fil_rev_8_21_14_0_10_49_15]|uniref:Nucleotidyl transferase domain-containing protein n=1 Tax=Candidatus Harrisonbacteria bacterium CG10_big_fil_rev_8_21_14_0_10_49_15 TaxID=1974587 RepID=A0A2H0ULX0_9BACT|nr:MAG: hypothetical protein COU11_00630 [Candidatus Harrisonbacteria bacterium CG10_big_fil_rev_8_21_14_0_10_49_15]